MDVSDWGIPIWEPTDPQSISTFSGMLATALDELFDGREMQNYRWPLSADRTAETGMREGDTGYQVDTKTFYIYDGSGWVVDPRPRYCSLRKSANQSTSASVSTPIAISWDIEDSDRFGMHDNVTNNTRIYAVASGIHRASSALYLGSTSGTASVHIRLNGTTDLPASTDRINGAAGMGSPLGRVVSFPMNAGDYIEFMAASTVATQVIAGGVSSLSCQVSLEYVGPV